MFTITNDHKKSFSIQKTLLIKMAISIIDLTFETIDLEFDNDVNHIDSDGVISRELSEQINSYEMDFLGIQLQGTQIRSRPRAQIRQRPRTQLRPKAAKTNKTTKTCRPFQQILDPDEECCICYEKLSQKRSTKLKCGHVFHTLCIRKWGSMKMECPMDRKKIRASDLK